MCVKIFTYRETDKDRIIIQEDRRLTMKKIASVALIVLLAAMLAVQSFALPARPATITLPKVGENTPVIDGVFDPFEGWGDPLVHIDNDS